LLACLGCVLAGRIPAQAALEPPARWLVTMADSAFPERVEGLHRLRSAIRAGADAADYGAEIDRLRRSSAAAQEEIRAHLGAQGGRVVADLWPINAVVVECDQAVAAELTGMAGVAAVAPDRIGTAHIRVATDAANHNADLVQKQLGLTGVGTTLALLDSGIDFDCAGEHHPHPAFRWSTNQEASRIVGVFGIAVPGDIEDIDGHGTAVAGVAVAVDWNSVGLPSDHGFAPGASLVSYKIASGPQSGYRESDLLTALTRVLEDRVRFGITVANLSYSGDPSPTYITQRHIDLLGFFGEVLVVTSAGNDGGNPNPTARSSSNANGLCVGAVVKNTHVVAGFSTPGPLLGDPGRTWPDLVAIGSTVVTPWPDRPQSTGLPLTGTSFAAPAVAGTALLLRAAMPSLSVLDTKALILNNTADVTAANPGLNRNHYGLGLLRTDLAATALTTGQLHRGQLRQAAPSFTLPFVPNVGTAYSATLVWPRIDLNSSAWDNLDLEVRDPGGRTIAVSDSPRNLYEKVFFMALSPGTYTLHITATALLNEDLDWTLAIGINAGGGRQPGSYSVHGTGCPGTGPDPAHGVIVPLVLAGRWGTARTTLPLAFKSSRIQLAYSAADVPTGLAIDRIAFRRDEAAYGVPGFQVDLQLFMGHTAKSPADLSPVFDANPDAGGMTLVLDHRTLDLPGSQGLPRSLGQFDHVLPLDSPFTTMTGPSRNLLIEMRVYGHPTGNGPLGLWFDAELDPIGHSIVYTDGNPFAASGQRDTLGIAVSLMHGLTGTGVPALDADRLPQLGGELRLVLRRAPIGATATLLHATAMFAMPIELGALGAPGCRLYSAAEVALPMAVGTAGQGAVRYLLPNDPTLTGRTFHNQFLILDPAANQLGITVSNGGTGRIGG
jgi:hypothetical protein